MLLRLAAVVALLAIVPVRASAQTSLVTCSSRNDQRATCRVDLRDGVLLERQLSRSVCEFGDTWGLDSSRNNTIWVASGCRGEFRVRAPTGGASTPSHDPYASPARETYVKGYRLGMADKQARRRADIGRHRDQYAAAESAHFKRGYDDGYNGRPAETAAPDPEAQQRAQALGTRRGSEDRRYRLPSDYARWRGDYESAYEAYFRRGYDEGYGISKRDL